ncbi:MAG: amidinotransferase [Gammaproteobacteria bacterium]|nr:amidinotransferase [Gammaproteobacteria bacterium]
MLGKPFPEELVNKAEKELNDFVHILEQEGIVVKRPTPFDFTQTYKTPHIETSGLYAAMPRDVLTVIGNEVIEAPMAWPSRYFEFLAYQNLKQEYLDMGCQWTQAPKGSMSKELYCADYPIASLEDRHKLAGENKFVTTEHEICFDAADVVRMGKDIFIQRSQVTNEKAIAWLTQHLKETHRVQEIRFKDPNPMHIDATFVPLRPGLILINPDRPCLQAQQFKDAGWDLVKAAAPCLPSDWPLYLSSKWLCMNILLLDTKRVVVERQEELNIKLFKSLGFEVIPVDFRHVYSFGGSFHCVTCDIRRDSRLEDFKLIKE